MDCWRKFTSRKSIGGRKHIFIRGNYLQLVYCVTSIPPDTNTGKSPHIIQFVVGKPGIPMRATMIGEQTERQSDIATFPDESMAVALKRHAGLVWYTI